MSKVEKFVALELNSPVKKHTNAEPEFVLNEFSAKRKEKLRPENQLEPDINEIQRFVKREN